MSDWTLMQQADFDESAPLALVDDREVSVPVLAVVHGNGTEPLFGSEPAPQRTTRRRMPAPGPTPGADTLF